MLRSVTWRAWCILLLAGLVSCFTDQGDATTATDSATTSSGAASDTTVTASGASETTGSGGSSGSTGAATTGDATASTTATNATTTAATTTTATTTEDPLTPPTLCELELDAFTLEEPVALDELNTSERDSDPFFAGDGLTLYFATNLANGADVFTATRAGPGALFGSPQLADALGVNSPQDDTKVQLLDGGLTLLLSSARDGGEGGFDIWLGARADADAPFQELVNAGPSINAPDNEIDPHASADGLRLYFAGEYNGELTIYSSSRPDARSEFSPRALLPNIETGNFRSTHPIVSDDERVLIYTSARDGSDDLWLAHRDSVDDDFGPSAPLPVVNTEAFEGEAALSPDGCELIFASDRADPGANGWDLYYTRVIPR